MMIWWWHGEKIKKRVQETGKIEEPQEKTSQLFSLYHIEKESLDVTKHEKALI